MPKCSTKNLKFCLCSNQSNNHNSQTDRKKTKRVTASKRKIMERKYSSNRLSLIVALFLPLIFSISSLHCLRRSLTVIQLGINSLVNKCRWLKQKMKRRFRIRMTLQAVTITFYSTRSRIELYRILLACSSSNHRTLLMLECQAPARLSQISKHSANRAHRPSNSSTTTWQARTQWTR